MHSELHRVYQLRTVLTSSKREGLLRRYVPCRKLRTLFFGREQKLDASKTEGLVTLLQ